MDLTPGSTHTLDTADTQIPPATQPSNTSKSLSFTNGSLKRYHPTATAPPPPSMVVSYKECLKNHAASIGGHALDGCGEFMPSPGSIPSDPRSLKCAACGCHRNFHRRDPQDYSNPHFVSCFYSPSAAAPPPPPPLPHRGLSPSTSPSLSPSPSPSPSPISSPSPPPVSHFPPSFHTSAPHMLLALGTPYSGPTDEHHRNFRSTMMKADNPVGKKRYRTKFSQEQKEKMYSFSEKLGWKMQKGDNRLVQEFCNEVGVSRGVFKVWMHNNKNTLRKRSEIGNPQTDEKINGDDNGNGGRGDNRDGFDSDINNIPLNNTNGSGNDHRNVELEDSCVNLHVSINESS